LDFYVNTAVPILGVLIAISTAAFLIWSYSSWYDRFTRTTKEREKGIDIAADVASLSNAGTMQLRTIAKAMHVKRYSKLKRPELILAIVSKKDELWRQQQGELFK